MNPYRHRHASEAASSSAADSSSRQGLRLPGTSTAQGYYPPAQFGYSSSAPAIPMPAANQNWHQQEAYPLQSEMSQHHRVLHTHVFKEVTTCQSGTPVRRLMITEVDNQGTERNRQREFFFNGMIGHVRPRGGGYINSWAEATRLSNYWRRFYNIDQVYEDQSDWYPQDHHGSPDNAALDGEDAEISDLADDTSAAVETGQLSVPSQINQLATVLYNIPSADREFNAPILEKIETSPADPNANPIQVWPAADLSHLSSHLAITASTLAQHVQPDNFEDISDISD